MKLRPRYMAFVKRVTDLIDVEIRAGHGIGLEPSEVIVALLGVQASVYAMQSAHGGVTESPEKCGEDLGRHFTVLAKQAMRKGAD